MSAPSLITAANEPELRLLDREIQRRVMFSQMLFTAGNALTTGGFFNYFIYEFHPSAFLLATLLIAPEVSQSLSVLGRWVAVHLGGRKRTWMICLIAGRIACCLIPGALAFPGGTEGPGPLLLILGCTVAWYLAQGIAYVNYISWLSDLASMGAWGRLFGSRQFASLLVATGVPLATVALRGRLLRGLPETAERLSYALLFVGGSLLCIASILPMLPVADVSMGGQSPRSRNGWWTCLSQHQSFRFLLASRWWLAFFQGLTQAVLFKYARDQLGLSLELYTVLTSMMLALQLPLTRWGARLSDRGMDRTGLFWALLAVSFALPCWMVSTREFWQPVCLAYALWGGFGLVNVCLNNLCLKLAPRSDNTTQFAVFEQVGGLIAGLAGLLGGYCLDRLLAGISQGSPTAQSAFLVLMAVSWLGRLTAPLWLLGVRQPTHT